MTDIGLLGDRTKALAKLRETEGWKVLSEIYAEKKTKYVGLIGRQVLSRIKLDQRELDFRAGYFRGISDLLGAPDAIEQVMEAALQEQRLQEQGAEK
jgi:hypothetical protein